MLNIVELAAKQEAFEESMKLKNQFRTLDDEEVEFLDSIMEIERTKEAAVRKENAKGLEAFRKQREAAERAEAEEQRTSGQQGGDEWIAKKKRKREKASEALSGLKVRRTSSKEDIKAVPNRPAKPRGKIETTQAKLEQGESSSKKSGITIPTAETQVPARIASASPVATGLGLAAYSSDED